jgi:hypothetical protein
MILPGHDHTWMTLQLNWQDAAIRGLGPVRMARASVRRERFPWVTSTSVIAAIQDNATTSKKLWLYASSNPDQVARRWHRPFLIAHKGGMSLTTAEEFFSWPMCEAIWSELHDADVTDLVTIVSWPYITKSWVQHALPGWDMADNGAGELTFWRKTTANLGVEAMVEVTPSAINIYLGDEIFAPRLIPGDLAFSLPAQFPNLDIMYHLLPERITHEARAVMRWYRSVLFRGDI